MRSYFVYYLKILWAICIFHQLAAGAIRISRDEAYKKFLALRSLPFEDCGKLCDLRYKGYRTRMVLMK